MHRRDSGRAIVQFSRAAVSVSQDHDPELAPVLADAGHLQTHVTAS